MDDSGKIPKFEDYAIFAGIVFTESGEISEFLNRYQSATDSIKCGYCQKERTSCDHACIEIKGQNIKNKHRRRLINLSSKYTTFATVIYNQNLHKEIIRNANSKGRFVEYSQRRIIKETIKYLIKKKVINPSLPVYLHVNIDEMPTKTNGYYSLREGLIEELRHGIVNYDYGRTFSPILHNKLTVKVVYKDSKKDFGIQMADIIANSVRKAFVINNSYYSTVKYLKNVLKIKVILRLPN